MHNPLMVVCNEYLTFQKREERNFQCLGQNIFWGWVRKGKPAELRCETPFFFFPFCEIAFPHELGLQEFVLPQISLGRLLCKKQHKYNLDVPKPLSVFSQREPFFALVSVALTWNSTFLLDLSFYVVRSAVPNLGILQMHDSQLPRSFKRSLQGKLLWVILLIKDWEVSVIQQSICRV